FRRKREVGVQFRIACLDAFVEVGREFARGDFLRRERCLYAVDGPVGGHYKFCSRPNSGHGMPCPYWNYRSMTLGTRKNGGSGSGACFKISAAIPQGTTTSSRSVASAVWSSVRTCAIGSTFSVLSSFSLPIYSRISSTCAR